MERPCHSPCPPSATVRSNLPFVVDGLVDPPSQVTLDQEIVHGILPSWFPDWMLRLILGYRLETCGVGELEVSLTLVRERRGEVRGETGRLRLGQLRDEALVVNRESGNEAPSGDFADAGEFENGDLDELAIGKVLA